MHSEFEVALSRLFAENAFPEDAFFVHKAFAGKTIIVYGAGESFHYFKEVVMRRFGHVPALVLDRRFRPGDSFEGIRSASPVDYTPSADERENALVVVCLGQQRYFDDVVATLRQLGFRQILALGDIYEIHNPFSLPEELEASGFAYYAAQRARIEECLALFEDDRSREVYVRCLETHLRRRPVPIPMSPRSEQYTPAGIRLSRGYSRFLYCGVSVGELASVFSRVGAVDELVCFEPDPNQFALTAKYLGEHQSALARRVTALPCAVYSRETVASFSYSDTSFGSRILASGQTHVQCVSIDHVLPGFRPTFINMDIEGAELDALQGAEGTLRACQPGLAVCVYHSPNHLWEIPLYLHGLGLGYRFYLRNYTSFVGETVLYASV